MNTEKQILIKEIRERFNEVHSEEKIKGRKNWTKAFFDELKKMGIKNGYKVYSSSTSEPILEENGGGEWLFDLCWSIEESGNEWQKKYKGLKLICECEWNLGKSEFLHDFHKLAVAKADIKIMLIQCKDLLEFNNLVKMIRDYTDDSLLNDGATYVLVGSGNNSDTVDWKNFDKE